MFNIGDEVITNRFDGQPTHMNEYIGVKGIITFVNIDSHNNFAYLVHEWLWPASALTKYKEVIPRKHAELIIQWANDSELEIELYNDLTEEWDVIFYPKWNPKIKYRIKEKQKPDIVKTKNISLISELGGNKDNVECTFDGNTGALKTIRML